MKCVIQKDSRTVREKNNQAHIRCYFKLFTNIKFTVYVYQKNSNTYKVHIMILGKINKFILTLLMIYISKLLFLCRKSK